MSDMKAIEEKFKAACKKAKNKENRFVSAFYSMIMFKKMYKTNTFACEKSGFKLWIQDLAGSLCFTLAHDTSLSSLTSSLQWALIVCGFIRLTRCQNFLATMQNYLANFQWHGPFFNLMETLNIAEGGQSYSQDVAVSSDRVHKSFDTYPLNSDLRSGQLFGLPGSVFNGFQQMSGKLEKLLGEKRVALHFCSTQGEIEEEYSQSLHQCSPSI